MSVIEANDTTAQSPYLTYLTNVGVMQRSAFLNPSGFSRGIKYLPPVYIALSLNMILLDDYLKQVSIMPSSCCHSLLFTSFPIIQNWP